MKLKDAILIIILFAGVLLAFTTFAVMKFVQEEEVGPEQAMEMQQEEEEPDPLVETEARAQTRLGGAMQKARETVDMVEERDRGMME